jgi:hypothetical protein
MPNTTFKVEQILHEKYRIPSITAYNRIEPSPRNKDFDRSLAAGIRDPLWMLTRQWQFGEFQGEDAASAVTARILGEHTSMKYVTFGENQKQAYSSEVPLEADAESEALPRNLFMAVQTGRRFLKLMKEQGLIGYLPALVKDFPFTYVPHPNDFEGLQLLKTVEGKLFDGLLIMDAIATLQGGITLFGKWMNDNLVPTGDQNKFSTVVSRYTTWFERNYYQKKAGASAWLPSHLEYRFELHAESGTRESASTALVADQYSEGHLDWYSFDLRTSAGDRERRVDEERLSSFIPTPVSFRGMPHPRYWMMEEGQTDFGKIETSTTGLLHLLLAEFGLIYSNDWFLLPYPVTVNSLCEIKGIMVTDVFGQDTIVHPAGRGKDDEWQRWAMFDHTDLNNSNNLTNKLYMAPALTKSLQGKPLEQVNFLRDEMANLVWAVENTVPSQAGKGVSGNEMAATNEPEQPFVPAGEAAIRYVIGTTVPANWIPFVPVKIKGNDREIRLQRARMPGQTKPLGSILTEKTAPYYINEEEVPRSGVIVDRAFQRTRWIDGKTYLWIGRQKKTGKGEGWSNLKFDQIADIVQK